MPRLKADKTFSKPARISDELHRYLELRARAEKDASGVEPKFGALLDGMCAHYLEQAKSWGAVPVLPTGRQRDEDHHGRNTMFDIGKDLSPQEGDFLRECLRIFRSEFRKPLQENVTFFGIGLSAVEQIASLELGDERPLGDATAPSPGEQRAFAIARNAQNANNLLKKTVHDVIQKLRGAWPGNPETSERTMPRRKSDRK